MEQTSPAIAAAARAVHGPAGTGPDAGRSVSRPSRRPGLRLVALAGALALLFAAPSVGAHAATAASASESPFTKNEDFIRAAVGPAQASMRATGVPASVIIAQAALESDFGRAAIGPANNYFGIKATTQPGPAGVFTAITVEYVDGKRVVVEAKFRAYHSMEESFTDHGRFLRENPRYRAAFAAGNDAREFARRIHAAGYATDPEYANKLIRLMERYNLFQYDQLTPAAPASPAPAPTPPIPAPAPALPAPAPAVNLADFVLI